MIIAVKTKFIAVSVFIVIGVALFSSWCAESTYHTDFAAFYRAGSIVLSDTLSATDVYRSDDQDVSKFNIPDNEGFIQYRYSMLAAYTFAPLALFDYYTAKTIFIFINIMAYIISVALVLWASGAKERWFVYPLYGFMFWVPFIQNIRWGQSNALILFFIVIGILAAKNNRSVATGVSLAIATLFKPFALAVTMVLCLKNWRLVISYGSFILITLLILPGTSEWFQSFLWPPHPWFCYSAIYLYLNTLGPYYFWSYALIIGAISALVTYYHRHLDYLVIGALAIPAAFLAMPILEIQYPTILIFSYAYLVPQILPNHVKLLSIISFLLVFAGSLTTQTPQILYSGILLIWLAMICLIVFNGKFDRDVHFIKIAHLPK